MSYLHDALLYHLKANAGIAALVGARVYNAGGVSESAARPYLVIQQIGGTHERHQLGSAELANKHYQVSCVCDTKKDALALQAVVMTALQGYVGNMGDPADTIKVYLITHTSEMDMPIPPPEGKARGGHQSMTDFSIWHYE